MDRDSNEASLTGEVDGGTPRDTPRYRVGMVAKLTGLSTHTLRMWEKRHEAVVPARTPAGGRLYSDADVERLSLLKRLVDAGHSIGSIANLDREELERTFSQQRPPKQRYAASSEETRERFLAAVMELDVVSAERVISRAAVAFQPREFLSEIVEPTLTELGRRWDRGDLRIVHEHLASSILRSLLVSMTRVYGHRDQAPRAVIATPATERHEFGALMVAMLMAMDGWHVVYLGTDLPAEEILFALERTPARVLLLSVVRSRGPALEREVETIERGLVPGVKMVVGGRAGRDLRLRRGVYVNQLDELERHLPG